MTFAVEWSLLGAFIAGGVVAMFITMIVVGSAMQRELRKWHLIPRQDDPQPDDTVVRITWPNDV